MEVEDLRVLKNDEQLIKKIGKYNLIIGIPITIIISIFIGKIGVFFLVGLFHAFINLYISSVCIKYLLMKEGKVRNILVVLDYILRIGSVCAISIILIYISELMFFVYIAGYSSHILSIFTYGVKLNFKERKW